MSLVHHRLTRSLSSVSLKHPLTWLDLRGYGLSALERLSLEELLLRHDPLNRCWGIVGCHEPVENRILDVATSSNKWGDEIRQNDVYGHEVRVRNKSCAIILGIGGKIDRLVNLPLAKQDGVLILRRFSGGGTVIVDHDSLWTTFIGRNDAPMSLDGECVKPFPREIMAWSADTIFEPAFCGWNRLIIENKKTRGTKRRGKQTLVFQGKSCGISGGVGESFILPSKNDRDDLNTPIGSSSISSFQLKENDYVLGERKMGGNAQSIVSTGFLHHTSFLWDYDSSNMEYLTLPDKRPEYRGDRSHDEFLVKLKDQYGTDSTKNEFFDQVKIATGHSYELEECSLNDALDIANEKFVSFQDWFNGKCRTTVVHI